MSITNIQTNKDLEEFLQRLLDRLEVIEKQIQMLDLEVSELGEAMFEPIGGLDS